MQFTIGLDAKLYQGAAGAPAATEITQVSDVTLNMEFSEAKANSRASKFALSDVGLCSVSLEFNIIWDPTDASFLALWNAFMNRTAIALKCLSAAGGKGVDADFKVHKFSDPQNLEEGQYAQVTVKPCPSTRLPAFVA